MMSVVLPGFHVLTSADQTGKFGQGYLESSNVNAIEELIRNIDMQRQFEINVKLIKKASDLDSAGAKLLDLPT